MSARGQTAGLVAHDQRRPAGMHGIGNAGQGRGADVPGRPANRHVSQKLREFGLQLHQVRLESRLRELPAVSA